MGTKHAPEDRPSGLVLDPEVQRPPPGRQVVLPVRHLVTRVPGAAQPAMQCNSTSVVSNPAELQLIKPKARASGTASGTSALAHAPRDILLKHKTKQKPRGVWCCFHHPGTGCSYCLDLFFGDGCSDCVASDASCFTAATSRSSSTSGLGVGFMLSRSALSRVSIALPLSVLFWLFCLPGSGVGVGK